MPITKQAPFAHEMSRAAARTAAGGVSSDHQTNVYEGDGLSFDPIDFADPVGFGDPVTFTPGPDLSFDVTPDHIADHSGSDFVGPVPDDSHVTDGNAAPPVQFANGDGGDGGPVTAPVADGDHALDGHTDGNTNDALHVDAPHDDDPNLHVDAHDDDPNLHVDAHDDDPNLHVDAHDDVSHHDADPTPHDDALSVADTHPDEHVSDEHGSPDAHTSTDVHASNDVHTTTTTGTTHADEPHGDDHPVVELHGDASSDSATTSAAPGSLEHHDGVASTETHDGLVTTHFTDGSSLTMDGSGQVVAFTEAGHVGPATHASADSHAPHDATSPPDTITHDTTHDATSAGTDPAHAHDGVDSVVVHEDGSTVTHFADGSSVTTDASGHAVSFTPPSDGHTDTGMAGDDGSGHASPHATGGAGTEAHSDAAGDHPTTSAVGVPANVPAGIAQSPSVGDCYILAAQNLAGASIADLVSPNPNGTYDVVVYDADGAHLVTVMPTATPHGGTGVGTLDEATAMQIWEQGAAKFLDDGSDHAPGEVNDYTPIANGGNPGQGLSMLGATDVHSTLTTNASPSSYNIVEHTTAGDWVIVSVAGGTPASDDKLASWGLIPNHAYGVVGIYTHPSGLQVVQLQNPHDPNGQPLDVPAVVFDSVGNTVSWGTPPGASPETSYGPGETPGNNPPTPFITTPDDQYGPGDRPSDDTSYQYTYGDDGVATNDGGFSNDGGFGTDLSGDPGGSGGYFG